MRARESVEKGEIRDDAMNARTIRGAARTYLPFSPRIEFLCKFRVREMYVRVCIYAGTQLETRWTEKNS